MVADVVDDDIEAGRLGVDSTPGGPALRPLTALAGEAPQTSPVALLLLDVINDLEWQDGDLLFQHFEPAAPRIRSLATQARAAGVPVIYVNDNYGKWRSDCGALVEHCLEDGVRGRPIVEMLRPHSDDYFVLKPKHSGFFSTTLDLLLKHLGVRTLVLTGVAGNICVLFTAADAHMRDYGLVVPSDCVASNSPEENEHALTSMSGVLGADTRPSKDVDLVSLRDTPR
jgi:nicotinamidase-related amidase